MVIIDSLGVANVPTFGTGEWLLSGGTGTIQTPTNNETGVVGLAAGVNTFKWVITEGSCSGYDEVQITNNEPTNPMVCRDTIDICTDFTNLCANLPPDGETAYWTKLSGNGVIDDSESPNTFVYNLSFNTSFTWTIQKGICEKSDTVFIGNGSVDAITTMDTVEFCGPEGLLSGNEPLKGHGTWILISGTGNIANSTAYITDVTGLSEGANTFRWTVVDGDCSDSDDQVLVNNLYPVTANMAATNPICEPEVWVVGNPPDGGATGEWSFSSGIGYFDDINSPATRAYDIAFGANTARWTISKGSCDNYAEVSIINRTIVATATSPVIVCTTTEVAAILAGDPAPGTGVWELISGAVSIDNSTAFSTTVTDVGYGSNSLSWTVSNGDCSDDVSIVVQNNFFTITAGNDRTICDTTTVLSGTNPGNGTGMWTVGGGFGDFVDATAYSTRVNGLLQGENTFTWNVTKNSCSASKDVVITNGLPTAVAGGNSTICKDSIILAATQPSIGSGLWSLTGSSGTIVQPTAYNSLVRHIGHGQNTFRWTVTNGQCPVYDDITIYNYTIMQTAGDDQQVCDTFTTLAADPPGANGSGYWSIVGGGALFLQPTLFNTEVWGLYDGMNTYAWTVSENGCSGTSQVVVQNNRFDVFAGYDEETSVANIDLKADIIPLTIGTWSVSGGGGVFDDIHFAKTVVNNLQYGVNTFVWSVYDPATGCTGIDDVNITFNGFPVDAGPDQYICADTACLSAVYVYNATTYWTIDYGSCHFTDITSPTSCIYDIAHGENILRWNVSKNGFSASDVVSIYNYSFDVDAGPNQHLCDNETQLDGTAPINTPFSTDWTGQWIIKEGGGNLVNSNNPNTDYNNISPDANLVLWSVSRSSWPGGNKQCTATDSVFIIYHQMPVTSFNIIPDVAMGCSPFEVTFLNTTPTEDTIPGTMYTWNFANQNQITVTHDSMPEFTFYNESDLVDTVYTIDLISKVLVASGLTCIDSASNIVTVWPVPIADFKATPITAIFPNSNIGIEHVSSDNCESYSWNFGDGHQIIDYEYIETYSHYYGHWGRYTITLEVWNEHCSDIATQMINIIAAEPTSSGDNSVKECAPLNLQLLGNVDYTTSGDTVQNSEYRWVILKEGSDDTVAVLNRRDPIYYFSDAGTYFAKLWATGEGSYPPWAYTYIRTDTIIVYPVPVANFDVDPKQVMAPVQPIHCYNYSENAVEYLWNFGLSDGSAVSTEREPIYYYTDQGDYYISLQVWTNMGCTDKLILDVPVTVLGAGELVFPTAFVPDPTNANGGIVGPGEEHQNLVFIPQIRKGVLDYHLQIFNRWGELIYESDDVDVGWDGYINGILSPQDVYVYKASVEFLNGQQKSYVGSVTLLR